MTGMTRIGLAVGALAATGLVAGAGAQFRAGYPYQSGQDIYEHVCQGCHMPGGAGAKGAGAYPALAGDPRLAAPLYPAMVIIHGQKAMPSFADLTDAQIVEVTTYVRSHFGNHFPGAVTADQVKALRPPQKAAGGFRAG